MKICAGEGANFLHNAYVFLQFCSGYYTEGFETRALQDARAR